MGRGIRIHRMEIAVAVFRHRLDFKWLWVVVEMKLVVSSGREEPQKGSFSIGEGSYTDAAVDQNSSSHT